MFYAGSSIKVGHRVEYAFDAYEHTPFGMTLHEDCEHIIHIITDTNDIYVSPQTRLLTARGVWKCADRLQQGEQLKHVACSATILYVDRVELTMDMYEVNNTDYVIVNGFYLDA